MSNIPKPFLYIGKRDGKFVIEINAKEVIPNEDMSTIVHVDSSVIAEDVLKIDGEIIFKFKMHHNEGEVYFGEHRMTIKCVLPPEEEKTYTVSEVKSKITEASKLIFNDDIYFKLLKAFE